MNKSNDDTITNKIEAIIKIQKKKRPRTNIKISQCTLYSSTLDQETKTKEPVHIKAKVVSMKRIKTKVYVRD